MGGGMMVSAWWVFWAFLGGGCAGMVLMAVMFVASAEDDRMESEHTLADADTPGNPVIA
jgi:hypothetical protein